MVTENGIAADDDTQRSTYLRSHLYAMTMAMKAGVDVRGYFHWSLLDCFEWQDGFTQKTGLYSIDSEYNRVAKGSTEVFREAARGMGLVPIVP